MTFDQLGKWVADGIILLSVVMGVYLYFDIRRRERSGQLANHRASASPSAVKTLEAAMLQLAQANLAAGHADEGVRLLNEMRKMAAQIEPVELRAQVLTQLSAEFRQAGLKEQSIEVASEAVRILQKALPAISAA